MLVVFLILFGILAKYAWPAIVRMMDERADFIDKGVEYAREAKRDREKAQEDAKDLLTEARKQQLEVLQQTERLKREMIAEARKAAENKAFSNAFVAAQKSGALEVTVNGKKYRRANKRSGTWRPV